MLYTGYERSDAGGKKDYPLTRLKWWCSKYANLFLCWSAMLFNVPLTTCIYSRPQKSCVFMNQSCLLSLINNNNNNKGGGGGLCVWSKNISHPKLRTIMNEIDENYTFSFVSGDFDRIRWLTHTGSLSPPYQRSKSRAIKVRTSSVSYLQRAAKQRY